IIKVFKDATKKDPTEEQIQYYLDKSESSIKIIDSVFNKALKFDKYIYLVRGVKLKELFLDFNQKILHKNYVSTTQYIPIARRFSGNESLEGMSQFYDIPSFNCC